ncbi:MULTISPECIES: N-formylglutamate amidohydrolase [unclassified Luteococcus]|uniref:N-formylglutamate amidohydrolase n=1 Tax=unclassified Luteococcus TaxID=2639923 RepID=UPI00313B67A2
MSDSTTVTLDSGELVAPYEFIGTWEGPVVATAIHTGHDLRPEVADLMSLAEDDRLREEDPFTHLIAQLVPARVTVNRSRFEVDLNRAQEQAVYRRPEDCWGLEVWRGGELPADVAERSLAVHQAFYTDLAARLDELAERGPFVLFDVHSYNHRRAGADQPASPQEENPDVNVGTGSLDRELWGDVVDAFSGALAAAEVQDGPLDVRENVRFRGANLAAWVHQRYPGRACALALEFKKTFMDEWTGQFDAERVAELSRALESTLDPIAETLRRNHGLGSAPGAR